MIRRDDVYPCKTVKEAFGVAVYGDLAFVIIEFIDITPKMTIYCAMDSHYWGRRDFKVQCYLDATRTKYVMMSSVIIRPLNILENLVEDDIGQMT